MLRSLEIRSITSLLNTRIPQARLGVRYSQMAFPCLDRAEEKTRSLLGQGPEPIYTRVQSGFEKFQSRKPLYLDYGNKLDTFDIAYETWGKLNDSRSNMILLHTGLSALSHAKSQPRNTKPGWWEAFIGPGLPLDTNRFFIVCTNILGGCYGSTGPSLFINGKRYGTSFPVITVNDMVRAQKQLVDSFGVDKLYASVGLSLGGMQSLAYASEFPEAVERVVSVSACARLHPYSIGMRFAQRQIVMHDPFWNKGDYYDGVPPHKGMKLARAVATITYRSGPEWELRFARARVNEEFRPAFCPDFLVETYLDHQGDKFSLEYDPNSFLYVSKAMDLFDLGWENREKARKTRAASMEGRDLYRNADLECIPEKHQQRTGKTEEENRADLERGLESLAGKQVLVVGAKSDILFPSWQQREVYEMLKNIQSKQQMSSENLTLVELSEEVSQYGHDTFLLDVKNVGGAIKSFLELSSG